MNLPWFIAKRISKGSSRSGQLSKPVVNIAMGGIMLGLSVMILTIFIVKGFQAEVKERTVAFGAHITIAKAANNNSSEPDPINEHQERVEELKKDERIAHVQQFITKNGLIKTASENEGVVVKGAGKNYNWGFIGTHMLTGKVFDPAEKTEYNPAIISKIISDRLGLETGDKMIIYFLVSDSLAAISFADGDTTVSVRDSLFQMVRELPEDEQPEISYFTKDNFTQKQFKITGVYETGLEDYDKKMVFTSESALKKICRWPENLTGGFELLVKDFDKLDETGMEVYDFLKSDMLLTSYTIKEANPGIFEWLNMHDTTALIVLVLMIVVSVINMVSALIILIIEKVNMIGILKALGMSNGKVMQVFIIQAGRLIAKGMLFGNLLGLGLAVMQHYLHIFKLDQATYYMPYVPIKFEWMYLILLNAGTFSVCLLSMLLPALVVSKTTPIKAIKFG